MHRRLIAPFVGLVATLAIAGTALAGGWATIVPDDTFAPTPGEPTDIGFTVMQHGQTPVSWVSPSVVVTDTATGASRSFPAEQVGKEGHFAATVTVPTSGAHTWAVTMPDLEVTSQAIAFTTLGASTSGPQVTPDEAGVAVKAAAEAAAEADRLRSELTVTRAAAIALAAALVGILAIAATVTFTRRRSVDRPADTVAGTV